MYVSRLGGSRRRCLTCGRLAGPSGFPEQRLGGDWILFCSMGAQPEHYGAPCLGGYGSDLYAIRPDGTGLTRLTRSSAATAAVCVPHSDLSGRARISPSHAIGANRDKARRCCRVRQAYLLRRAPASDDPLLTEDKILRFHPRFGQSSALDGSINMTHCWNRESGRSGVATRKISGATAPQQEKCTR